MSIDRAKSFAAMFAGFSAIAASAASGAGYTLPAIVAGGCLLIAGIGLAIATRGS